MGYTTALTLTERKIYTMRMVRADDKILLVAAKRAELSMAVYAPRSKALCIEARPIETFGTTRHGLHHSLEYEEWVEREDDGVRV